MKKKLVSVGFFSELKHGRVEGGSLRASLQPTAGPDDARLVAYLRAGKRLMMAPGPVRDVLAANAIIPTLEILTNGTRASLAPMLFSAEARSFYLIGSPATQDYSVGGDCKLKIGSAAPEAFVCVGSMLQLPTATLDLATTQQATVLDGVTAPGRYTY
jgi:hypothetical protein